MCVLYVIDGKTNELTRVSFACSECGRSQLLKKLIMEENLHHDGSLIMMRHNESYKESLGDEELERAHYLVRELARSQGWA